METLAAVVATGRDRDGPVVEAPDRTAEYTYREFSTNAWKVGNLLRHYGVRPGASLGVVAGPKEPSPDDRPGWLGSTPEPILAFLGGATLGAVVDFEPPQPVDARALVLPDAWLDRYDAEPGCSRIAYGGPPETPGVAHFEREFWSENPTRPPDTVGPGDPLLRVGDREYTHADLLTGAQSLVDEYSLTGGDRVAIDAPVTAAGTVVAGVAAPLLVGATIRLGTGDCLSDDVVYVVSAGSGWERPRVDPAAVLAD